MGCIERRDVVRMDWLTEGVCEYDGRLSLVEHRGSLVLYARANFAKSGQRFVQAATRTAGTWSAFRPIELMEYQPRQGDVYFFAVQVNPLQPATLLALFPLVHHLHGCIAAAVSRDGFRWSTPTPLAACQVFGDRTMDHPVAGGVTHDPAAGTVHIYVHQNVPGAQHDRFANHATQRFFEHRGTQFTGRLVRHTLTASAWAQWTAAQLKLLGT